MVGRSAATNQSETNADADAARGQQRRPTRASATRGARSLRRLAAASPRTYGTTHAR